MDASDKAVSGRRGFLGAAAAPVAWHGLGGAGEATAQPASPDTAMQVTLTVNGREHPLMLAPRTTLLDALRERVGLVAPRRAATTANAAPAPSTSTASGCSVHERQPVPLTQTSSLPSSRQ